MYMFYLFALNISVIDVQFYEIFNHHGPVKIIFVLVTKFIYNIKWEHCFRINLD